MNYLAHAYLSFGDPQILIGNMIADFVPGKKKDDYPEGIRRGITIHRLIDAYTDNHPVTKIARKVYHPAVRLYDGAYMDITYDHFLALDPLQEPPEGWKQFCAHAYRLVAPQISLLPAGFRRLFSYMEKEDWLYNYRFRSQIRDSFRGLTHRARFLPDDADAFSPFVDNYRYLQQAYDQFFPQLKAYVESLP